MNSDFKSVTFLSRNTGNWLKTNFSQGNLNVFAWMFPVFLCFCFFNFQTQKVSLTETSHYYTLWAHHYQKPSFPCTSLFNMPTGWSGEALSQPWRASNPAPTRGRTKAFLLSNVFTPQTFKITLLPKQDSASPWFTRYHALTLTALNSIKTSWSLCSLRHIGVRWPFCIGFESILPFSVLKKY